VFLARRGYDGRSWAVSLGNDEKVFVTYVDQRVGTAIAKTCQRPFERCKRKAPRRKITTRKGIRRRWFE
jgi:hypothetical protein